MTLTCRLCSARFSGSKDQAITAGWCGAAITDTTGPAWCPKESIQAIADDIQRGKK